MEENVVLDVKPEEVPMEGANVGSETGATPVVAPKFDAKKGLLIGGLILTGLIAGYGVYRGVKWGKAKLAAKKAAKAETETETEETTEK